MTTRLERAEQELADAERIAKDPRQGPGAQRAAQQRLAGLRQRVRIAREDAERTTPTIEESPDFVSDDAYVESKVEEHRLSTLASERIRQDAAGHVPPVRLSSAASLLAEPAQETRYRVQDVMLSDSITAVFAQAKAGKSTLMLNLIRSLLDGTPFLGSLSVVPIEGTVVYANLELSDYLVRQWVADSGIHRLSDLHIGNYRGAASQFDFSDATIRERIVGELRAVGASVLIIDPLGPLLASVGLSENDTQGIRGLFNALTELKREAGLSEVVVVHHAGHAASTRGRGSSEFLAAPDTLWVLEKVGGSRPTRYFSVDGRDTSLSDRRLSYDPATRAYTLSGERGDDESVKEELTEARVQELIALLEAEDTQSMTFPQIVEATGWHRSSTARPTVDAALQLGVVEEQPAAGRRPAVVSLK